MTSTLGISSFWVAVTIGVLVWLTMIVTGVLLLVRASRSRRRVPRVVVEGHVVERWPISGHPRTIDFEYPVPDGTWRRGRGRPPKFTPCADGQPIAVHVSTIDPTDAILELERVGNPLATFAGVVLLCLAIDIVGIAVAVIAIARMLPTDY